MLLAGANYHEFHSFPHCYKLYWLGHIIPITQHKWEKFHSNMLEQLFCSPDFPWSWLTGQNPLAEE
jgi:hypothetical protein